MVFLFLAGFAFLFFSFISFVYYFLYSHHFLYYRCLSPAATGFTLLFTHKNSKYQNICAKADTVWTPSLDFRNYAQKLAESSLPLFFSGIGYE